ncbi:MAG: HU family DNA-binding protein [Bacteroidales bacterium]|nr:HU family DNA-binding protein [Bacteroidales bacterium]
MNKAQLIDSIANQAKLSKADAKRALDAFVDTTTGALKKGDRVALVGFGSFSVAKRNARTGRNPQTGQPITIKAKKVVKFKAGSDLADTVQ